MDQQQNQQFQQEEADAAGFFNKLNPFHNQPRLYDSPLASNAFNDSVNGSMSYGGCFNNSNQWSSPRYMGSSPFVPDRKKGSQKYGQENYSTQKSSRRYDTPRRNEPFSTDSERGRLRLIDLNNSSFATSSHASNSFSNYSRSSYKCTLPTWALDGQGGVAPSVTLNDVLMKNSLFDFATDKNGCRFLQEQYPIEFGDNTRQEIFHKMVESCETFLSMCRNMFGNFFIQRIVECSHAEEQEVVAQHLVTDMYALCFDKSACRVIQLAIQKLNIHLASLLSRELRGTDLVRLSIDQNGNHVIQKIIKTLPVSAWDFVIDYFQNDEYLINVCQDKYGCRVIQSTIEKLSENSELPCYEERVQFLHCLMAGIVRNCVQLASNEFANYVIQHVIKSSGVMEVYRDEIIEKCLLRNLLSMSQEKYASHVVEIAYLFAPHRLLLEMMEEIFEGYIPHPETNRDALDILLFHQYGNYIIQQMIHICYSVIIGEKGQELNADEIEMYAGWLDRIRERVLRNTSRLERFSSGKKIMEALNQTLQINN